MSLFPPPHRCNSYIPFSSPSLRYTFVDILRAILLSLESMIEDPELQVNGFILIIDWSNFTFKQASKLTPSMLRLAIEGLQVGALMRNDAVRCCHIAHHAGGSQHSCFPSLKNQPSVV